MVRFFFVGLGECSSLEMEIMNASTRAHVLTCLSFRLIPNLIFLRRVADLRCHGIGNSGQRELKLRRAEAAPSRRS